MPTATVIAGIEIPSTAPVFLGVVSFHVLVGLACVVTGAGAMLSRKAPGRHPNFGAAYYWGLVAVFCLGKLVSCRALAGRLPPVPARHGVVHRRIHRALGSSPALARLGKRHITAMGLSYILLLTAFYVDNGKSLPLWRDLPTIAYWLLPAAVGAPLLLHALLRHPLARSPGL